MVPNSDLVARRPVLRRTSPVTLPPAEIGPDQPATILYTSGSTGRPKGVVSTHRNIVTALLAWELEGATQTVLAGLPLPSTPTDDPSEGDQPAALLGVPLFHVLGLHAVFLASFPGSMRKLVCMTALGSRRGGRARRARRISTAISAPPTMTAIWSTKPTAPDRDLSSLRSVGGGGASPRTRAGAPDEGDTFAAAAPQRRAGA